MVAPMGTTDTTADLAAVRERVIKTVRQVVTWGGLAAIIASIPSSSPTHAWILIATYAGLVAPFWWPGASVDFRGGLLVFVCFASGAAQLLVDATHGSGYQILLASAVFAGLLQKRLIARISCVIIILAVFVITGLYGMRIITSPDPMVGGIAWWLSWSLSFAVIASALVATQQYIVGQLMQNLERLRKASAAKDELLAMVSHELRTPLTPALLILGGMERASDLSEQHRADIAIAKGQIEQEARLVSDLLDLSRSVSNKLVLQRSQCDVHSVIQSEIEAVRRQCEQKQLIVHQSLNATGCTIDGDGGRLHQVIRNLLDNAIKFSPQGGSITVSSANQSSPEHQWLVIQVQDTGIGIDPNWLGRAFSMFEQQDRSTTRQYGGMGVGLAICKLIIEEHGGTISAASDGQDKGSTFTIRLPVLDSSPLVRAESP